MRSFGSASLLIRRGRVSTAGLVLGAWMSCISPAGADTSAKGAPHRIGLLAWNPAGCDSAPLRQGLHELGHVPDKTYVFVCRDAGGDYSRIPATAADLVRTAPDVIVVFGQTSAEALHKATKHIPIVMIASGDPVASGLVASLARPGGNVTGMSYYQTELNAKRLELIHELIPGAKHVALVMTPGVSLNDIFLRDLSRAGTQLGLQLRVFEASRAGDLAATFEAMTNAGMEAVFFVPSYVSATEPKLLAELSAKHRLPAIHWNMAFTQYGGLMSYGPDYLALQKRLARYVDKVLAGAKPADLPVEQPHEYQFVLNRTVARAIGLTIPPSLLLRADKVIE